MNASTAIFLSYAGLDREAAAEIVTGLQAEGVGVWWDQKGIGWGDNWQDRLQKELSDCHGYIILIGQSGIRTWVKPELQYALRRHIESGMPIFPLLLPGVTPADLPPFLSLVQAEQLPGSPSQSDFEQIAVELKAAVEGEGTQKATDYSKCPYPGLESFGEADAAFFFGREVETVELLGRLGERPGAPYTRWLQVEGTSGVGKSSLLHAGFVPAVKRGWIDKESSRKRGDWVVMDLRPGKDPVMSLQLALGSAFPSGGFDTLRSTNNDDAALTYALRQATHNGSDAQVLLVIDQLEELFTMAEDTDRSRFDALLAHALTDPDCPLYLVTGIRSDFMMRFGEVPQLNSVLNDRAARYSLPPIGELGLRSAVRSPANKMGLRFSDGLSERIVTDGLEAGEAALPLVANVLRLLWDKSKIREDGELSINDYNTLRGVAGALAKSADGVIDSFSAEGREAARKLLLSLVNPGWDGPDTRKQIRRDEALHAAGGGKVAEQVLNRLSGSRDANNPGPPGPRLIVVGEGDDPPVDLAHELLLRTDHRNEPYWTKIKDWVDKYRDELKLRDRLQVRVNDWTEAGSPWSGSYLANRREIKEFKVVAPPGGPGKEFLKKSRNWQWIGGFTVAAGVISVGLISWFAANQEHRYKFGYAIGYHKLIVPEMRTLDKGTFVMGSPDADPDAESDEKPTRPVNVESFGVGVYEVTFNEYDQFALLAGRELPDDQGWGRGQRPVINVSWDDAKAYAEWLSSESKQRFRLPAEAEWEYAARAGTKGRYWWCAESEPNCDVKSGIANCDGCGSEWDNKTTAPAGSFAPNSFGVHDTAGNVWEWVEDCWHGNYEGAPKDGSAWLEADGGDCAQRVIRGGSWDYIPVALRSAYRYRYGAVYRYDDIGFRLAQDK